MNPGTTEALLFFLPLFISIYSLSLVTLIIYWKKYSRLKLATILALSLVLIVLNVYTRRLEKSFAALVKQSQNKPQKLPILAHQYTVNEVPENWSYYTLFDQYIVQIPPDWKVINTNDRRITFGQGIQPYITFRILPLELSTRYAQRYGTNKELVLRENATINGKSYTRYVRNTRCFEDTCNPQSADWFVPMSNNLIIVSVNLIGRVVSPVTLIITTLQEY